MKKYYLLAVLSCGIIIFFTFSVIRFTQKQPDLVEVGNTQEITLSEVRKHSTLQNCWVIVNSKVYNLSSFFTNNEDASACGSDATSLLIPEAPSSASAKTLNNLQKYYIGLIVP